MDFDAKLVCGHQLQGRYANRRCLVENTQHEKIFAYIEQQVCVNIKAPRQLFCSSLLFCFQELNRFLKTSVRATYIHTYIHTLLHSSPLGALPRYMNIKKKIQN